MFRIALSLLILWSNLTLSYANEYQITYKDLGQLMPQYAEIPNGRIEYYTIGEGTPLILISGYGTDITSWDSRFLIKLAKKHRLIIFNNRNVGGSLVQSKIYDSNDLARDTYQLIQYLHLKKPAVLGLSMGGMIALQLAALYPNDIGQLILINTAISGNQSIRPEASVEKMMLNMPTGKVARYLFALKLFFPDPQRIPMGLALIVNRFLPKIYTEIDLKTVLSQQKNLVLQWGMDNITAKKIAKLNLPVLILNGEADAVIPPQNSVILSERIKNAELRRWSNGGHAMIYQFPEPLADTINDFLL